MNLQVIGSVFEGGGYEGDFTWMIEQPDYADALFVFNDNEEQFRAHQQTRTTRGDVRAERETPRSARTSASNRSAPQASRPESIMPDTRS